MKGIKMLLALCMWFTLAVTEAAGQRIEGMVVDAKTREPLTGAIVQSEKGSTKTVTDINGKFALELPTEKQHILLITYIGYQSLRYTYIAGNEKSGRAPLLISLQADEKQLKEVTVTAVERKNTQTAMIQVAKNSSVVVNNVSAQDIKLTQDNHAGEVIRRVPGVSLIDEKFVMVRGLSQRYNNVWINGGAVPSSEADARAFSFDLIPGSQIENLIIVKTPTAEFPADYSGGFIMVNTQEIPSTNSTTFTVGGNWNSATVFRPFSYGKGSATDFLGFDSGLRALRGGMEGKLNGIADNGVSLTDNHFNNNWFVKTKNPLGDLKLNAAWNRFWNIGAGKLGVIASVNYTNAYRSYRDMENNLFGVYDYQNDKSNYLRHSLDNQFNHDVRLGAMFNVTFLSPNGRHKYQLKNIFNQIGNHRYTDREGVSAQSNMERSAEYFYRSRTTESTQLTGKHTLGAHSLAWSASYAYANRNQPDRRRYLVDDALESGTYALTTGNDIFREWTKLDEHIASANVSDNWQLNIHSWQPLLKAGVYTEYRTRRYNTREFIYNWNAADNNLPAGFRHQDVPTLLSREDYMGADKLYLLEQQQMRNNYRGRNTLGAVFLAAQLPFGKLGLLASVRFEHNDMALISNTRDYEKSETTRHYRSNDFFPSLAATYKFNERHQLRLAYGRSTNRPEFREIASSVYYDFDLASNVQGNPKLTHCYINNLDLRYEFYPSRGEQISVALFYKHFQSPIEWTYTVAGGTDLVYSYTNARSAANVGVEVEFRKDLSFIGLPHFSWAFNAALIHSRVAFAPGSKEANRPMQGQSPYLVNTGLFYRNAGAQIDMALLYNRIGKRIIGVGRSEGTTGDNDNARVPDSYEMPRNSVDLTFSKRMGTHWELKAAVKDILAEKVSFKQFADVTFPNGSRRTVEEVTRSYRPGRNVSLQITYQF